MASVASVVAAVAVAGAVGASVLRRRAARRKGVQSAQQDGISNLSPKELPSKNAGEAQKLAAASSRFLDFRVILGVGVCFGSFQASWQALPVLMDRKLVSDPALPLSDAQLKISETFIFVGWLLGAVALHPLMQRLDLKQVLILLAGTMLVVSVAEITLPNLTALSMTLLSGVRLIHGMCLNIQGVQYIYMQNCFPGYGSQLCSMVNTLYALMAMIMAMSCGSLTLYMDWRLESLLWYALPILLGLLVAFPDLGAVVASLPGALARSPQKPARLRHCMEAQTMTRSMNRSLCHLAFCFACTVFAYYGLSYSADSLSTNPFLSAWLIGGSDVLACGLASRASDLGRNRAQVWGFLVAAVSLIACAMGTVDSIFVISMAMLARVALSVVFVTIYVAIADIFPVWSQKTVLPVCEIMARVGGCLSPSCGALPVHLSMPLFGSACLLAARASAQLPDKYDPKGF